MNEIPIGSFLKERESRFSAEEANKLGLRRLKKIDFSGNIHVGENESTRTRMILVKKGDLILSGINVEKGAIAIYVGEPDVLATIHYSSYIIDESLIDVEYFEWFLKSRVFRDIVNSNVKGGIKTEIKPKRFLSLVVPLPSLEAQLRIRKNLSSVKDDVVELEKIGYMNKEYIRELRQVILREAISGEIIPQNSSNEPASELLKRIRAKREGLVGKQKNKREKEMLPISKEKELYQLPEGWEWTRLEEICYGITSGSTPSKAYLSTEKGIPFIKVHNIVNNKIDFQKIQYIDETIHRTKNERSILYPGDVVMNIVGPPLGKIAIVPDRYPELNCNQAIVVLRPVMKELNRWIYLFLCEGSFLQSIRLIGTAGQDNISITKSRNIMIPLPPLAEQELIAKKVDQLTNLVEKCEEYIKQSKEYSAALMESILEETFSFEQSKTPSKRAL